MPSNIEIKARVDDLEAVAQRAAALSDGQCRTMQQRDVFFTVPRGRLKLRFLSPERGELIYYERPDTLAAAQSQYDIAIMDRPDDLCTVLAAALGIRAVIEKTRRVYMVGRTRIHLDEVKDLGDFVELEVVLREGEAPEDGTREAQELMQALGIEAGQLVACAYVDLLE